MDVTPSRVGRSAAPADDIDLIQLDTRCVIYVTVSNVHNDHFSLENPVIDQDDIIFEDFARLRLRGHSQEHADTSTDAQDNGK